MRARRFLMIAAVGLFFAACDGDRGVRIVAITATATPATSPGANATPVGSATPPPVELPPRPDNPFAGGVAVSQYLAGGLANVDDCLPELVNAWELSPVAGPRCVAADIDGDGLDEFVLLITTASSTNPPGEAWFFDDAATHYRFFSSARALANAILGNLELAGVADFTGDGRPEIVFTAMTCETECTTSVVIASEHRGVLEDLAPDSSGLADADPVRIEDDNGDGLPDVLMRRDATAAPGPGPQRGLSRRLAWSGVRFTVIDDEDPPEFLIHLIEDADAAMRVGNLAEARGLYERAATDGALRDWKQESGEFVGRRELVPYALFRAALAAARLGDGAGAASLLGRAATDGANSMHSGAAVVYLSSLEGGRTASQACADAQRYLQPFAQAYQRFWDYGYANPEHPLSSLCP